MQVIKLTSEQINAAPKKHEYTEEEMQREYDYLLAQQMTENLLNNGLIAFCAAERPPVRLPAATQRSQRPPQMLFHGALDRSLLRM